MEMERKGWATHVGHNRSLGDMRHGVLDILFDESTESGVLELGRVGIRVSCTVVPKFDDFVTEYKANRQEMRGSRNGR
jgi:hypothetical protein